MHQRNLCYQLKSIPGGILAGKNGLNNYTLIGYDLLEQTQEFLKKGIIDFLISQKPREQGYKSVMALFNYLVMKKQIVKDQYLPIDIITKENIDFYINQ
jgi:LacI family transcriptional regulator